jgi:hypothetical protein
MKIRFLLTLAGLAIGFAVPTLAQEQNTVDPEVRQQIEAVLVSFGEAFNKHDAAAVATHSRWTRFWCWTGEKVVHFAVSKRSRSITQSILHRAPPNSPKNLFRCTQSETGYPLSRNGVTGNGRATTPGFMFVTSIPGRSAWTTPCIYKS